MKHLLQHSAPGLWCYARKQINQAHLQHVGVYSKNNLASNITQSFQIKVTSKGGRIYIKKKHPKNIELNKPKKHC